MCFFIYSPQREITVHYASESIESHRKKYNVIADLLIENNSDEKVSKLFVIFPHNLFKTNKENGEEVVHPTGEIEDISSDLFNAHSDLNRLYHMESAKLEKYEDSSGISGVLITLPSPASPDKNIILKGAILGENKLSIADEIKLEGWKILIHNKMSLLKCSLSVPIEKGGKRWFRWKFCPVNIAKGEDGPVLRILNWLRDNMIYRFSILSPTKVCEKLQQELIIYKRVLELKSIHKTLPFINELILKIFTQGIVTSTTNFLDWRVNLFRPRLTHVNIVSIVGDAKPAGAQPNLIRYKNEKGKFKKKYDYIFQWVAGIKNTGIKNKCEPHKKLDFVIHYETRVFNVFFKIIVWFSLIISAISLYLSSLK